MKSELYQPLQEAAAIKPWGSASGKGRWVGKNR